MRINLCHTILSVLSGICMMSCGVSADSRGHTVSGLAPEEFASVYRGDSTALYTLTNSSGMEVCITNFGGRVVSLMVPDRNGRLTDIVLGFDNIEAYFPENNKTDFGASVGRYANRINRGRFTIDGVEYRLPQNNFGHCLHGGGELGTLGWQYRVFRASQPSDSVLVLNLDSPDGDNGFPGNVSATVKYTLASDNELKIEYAAVTDKPTVVNMTNHSYFNLSGDGGKDVLNDILWVNADYFTPVDSTFMTSGEIISVKGTPFDFTTPKPIGRDVYSDDTQLHNANGYDHNWVLNTKGDITQCAVRLRNPDNGITLEVYTDEPGIQIYSGNFLDGSLIGKHSTAYPRRGAICLETQHYPDSPNKPQWPSTILRPGETYRSTCIYKFL